MVPAPSASAEARFAERIVRELDVDGVKVVVQSADMDTIFAILGHVEPIQAELAAAPQAVIQAMCEGVTSEPQKVAVTAWVVSLIARHRAAVKAIVAEAANVSEAWLGGVLPDRFITLTLTVLQVNADFFSQAAPVLAPLLAMLAPVGAAPESQPAET